MEHTFDRRRALASSLAWIALPPSVALGSAVAAEPTPQPAPSAAADSAASCERPGGRQEQELVQDVVGAAHGRFERVRELVEARPALAKAAWDWGFGDWETPLDAAAHTGQREIALYLLARGARATLFSAAMLGQLAVVRAALEADPGAARVLGPHSLTLLHHARAGGAAAQAVAEYLETRGDADGGPANAPLADADRLRAVGTYRADGGPGLTPVVVEVAEQRGRLTLKIGDGVPRGLFHRGGRELGGLEFQPAGAEAVRVRFLFPEAGRVLLIEDGATTRFLAQ